MKRIVVGVLSIVSLTAWCADVLLVREVSGCVERWQVSKTGWTSAGRFLAADAAAVPASGVAAVDGVVFVATKDNRILRCSPDGRILGEFARTSSRPDQLAVSPDGKTLVATSLPGNSLYFWNIATAKGDVKVIGGGPRGVAFGPDGYCYVSCRSPGQVLVFDLAGGKFRAEAPMEVHSGAGGLAFLGPDYMKVAIPGVRTKVADLSRAIVSRMPKGVRFHNCFVTVRIGGEAYAIDWSGGCVARLATDAAPVKVAEVGSGICAACNLTEALAGTDRAELRAAMKLVRTRKTVICYGGYLPADGDDLERMKFNNPGAVVELSYGIWPTLMVDAYSPDGGNDIRISYGSVPSKGYAIARNPLPKGSKNPMPVFKAWSTNIPPRTIRPPLLNYTLPRDNPHFRSIRGCERGWADLNGDGRPDAVMVVQDWTDYGVPGPACPLAYDAEERWTNSQIQAYCYWRENLGGEGDQTKWGEVRPILFGGKPTQEPGPYGGSAGWYDWDRDGDIDLLIADFISDFWYFENVGDAKRPEFAAGRRLIGSDGKPVSGELCMMSGRFFDWDGDGLPDVIASEEDGRVSFYRNTGKVKNGMPVFDQGRYFQQEADDLKFHCIPCPCGIDWDGDGDYDLVTGDTTGFIGFIENLSGPGVERPKWAPPKLFTVRDPENSAYRWVDDKRRIRSTCGPENSPQGPFEQKWGYTQVCVADWDGDGFLDILANDVKGSVVWFRNPGKKGTTEMFAARPIEVEWTGPQPQAEWEWRKPPKGKALRAPWRTTPAVYDWNGDGLPDLIMLDHSGVLVLYPRAVRNGKRVLLPPQRVFANATGEPLVMNEAKRGGAGRRKFCICDWNGDGRPDIVANWANAVVLVNEGVKNGVTRFANPRQLGERRLAGHPCCPTVADFNADGKPDLVIGAEDGYFYYRRNEPLED